MVGIVTGRISLGAVAAAQRGKKNRRRIRQSNVGKKRLHGLISCFDFVDFVRMVTTGTAAVAQSYQLYATATAVCILTCVFIPCIKPIFFPRVPTSLHFTLRLPRCYSSLTKIRWFSKVNHLCDARKVKQSKKNRLERWSKIVGRREFLSA